jgi:hypothetical protein
MKELFTVRAEALKARGAEYTKLIRLANLAARRVSPESSQMHVAKLAFLCEIIGHYESGDMAWKEAIKFVSFAL